MKNSISRIVTQNLSSSDYTEQKLEEARAALEAARRHLEKVTPKGVGNLGDAEIEKMIGKTEPRLRPFLGIVLDARQVVRTAERELAQRKRDLAKTVSHNATVLRWERNARMNGGAFGKVPSFV